MTEATSTSLDAVLLADERITTYGRLLEAGARLQRVFGRRLADDHDLPSAVFGLLLRLARSPGRRLTMTEIAAQLGITTGGVTRLIDRAIALGLVARVRCPEDRRVQWVGLSEAGEVTLAAALPGHVDDLERELFSRLSTQEIKQLSSIMDKLR